jgi:hypothetical protein
LHLIPIPSKDCPLCEKTNGECSVVIQSIQSIAGLQIKADEESIRADMSGKTLPKYREAYLLHSYLCSNRI